MSKRSGVTMPALGFLVTMVGATPVAATPVAYLQAVAGGQQGFLPGLPAQSCAFGGSPSASPVPTFATATCTLQYQDVAGLTSTITGQATGRADDFNTLRLFASEDWTNFIAPPGFFLPSFTPAGVGAFAVAHWEEDPVAGTRVNPTPFNLFLSGTMHASGGFIDDSPGAPTIFDGVLDARFILSSASSSSECDIPWNTHNGQFPSPQACTVRIEIPAFYNGPLQSILQGSLSVTQDSTVFTAGPSAFGLQGDFLNTMAITSFQLTDEQGNVLPLSTLNIGPDSGVMLTDRGFAPIGAAPPDGPGVPEPATLWLMLGGVGAIARRHRIARSR